MNAAAPEFDEAALRAAYRQNSAQALSRSIVFANVVAIPAMLSGATLDYFLYPEQFATFLGLRAAVSAVLAVITAVLYVGRAHPSWNLTRALGTLGGVAMTGSFCLMISRTDGVNSPYFAGINLVLVAWSALLPWGVAQTGIVCATSLLLYVAACLPHASLAREGGFALLGFNVSFILITTMVALGVTWILARARFQDFRLRHQLDAQNRQLQDLDRLKTQFFSNVSHELRTPLTLILGPVESLLARSETLEARQHEGLMLVHRNTLRLLKLINDLLDLTRLELGAEVLRKKRVVLGSFLRGVVDSVRHLGLSKQIRMRVEEGDPAAEALADASRLEKVLLNLLTNALKYTPPGGTVSVRWREQDGASIIEVQDTGVGIPAADRERVFDRFHQVRSNEANQNQGVGIGLALARELVEEHGGTIELESEEGMGSLFRVRLPLATAAPETSAVPESVPAPVANVAEVEEPFEKAFRSADRGLWAQGEVPGSDLPIVGEGSHVVLVADDERDMRRYIVSLLAEDHRVVQTTAGGNVAELVAEHRPELVLLDWMMPEKDGLTVCRELRANPVNADLKIMLLTARIDEKSKLDALAAGADDFLTKPFSSVEVKTRVANLLRSARLQRELRASNDELRATLEKLERTKLLLIQSEKMNAIGSLSAGLLHEINNPLNYTLTAVSLAERLSLGDDLRDLVGDIKEGMERVRDVITHLKTFAYPETSEHASLFPIGEPLRDARKIAAKELLDIEFDVDLADDLLVRGQRTQLTHLFINLLANAARALTEHPPRSGPKTITVRSRTSEEMLEVSVADNGPGIPPEILGRVFEPFFTTRDVGSGMGMGLSLCHTIMETHHGSIRVGNRPEGGAVFTIHMPLATPALKPC